MSIKNAQKVISYAASYIKFRAALRKSPKTALTEFSSALQLSEESCTNEEIDAVLSFSDDDYKSFGGLITTFAGNVEEGERTSLKIT